MEDLNPNKTGWSFQKIRLWAIIYFPMDLNSYIPISLDLVGAELTFKLNEIPTASLKIPAGRVFQSLEAGNFHYIVDLIRTSLPIQVWMDAREFNNSVSTGTLIDWPKKPFIIFEGLTTGFGFYKSRNGQAIYSIDAQHWLVQLNFSSALSRSSHVSNPSHYYAPAAYKFTGNSYSGLSWVSQGLGSGFLTGESIFNDIWSGGSFQNKGLWHFLVAICQQDSFFAPEIGVFPDAKKNDEALAALARFEPYFTTGGLDQNWNYQFGVPIALRRDFSLNLSLVHSAMVSSVIKETFIEQASTTIWDKIQGFKGDFLFSLVPMIDRALIVPVIAGLTAVNKRLNNQIGWQIIFAEDYEAIRISGEMPRPLRAIGMLMRGPLSEAGSFNQNPNQVNSRERIGAYYENIALPHGMTLLKRSPRWMQFSQPSEQVSQNHLPIYKIVANATNPLAGTPPVLEPPVISRNAIQKVADAYAKAVYVEEVLKGRTAYITGRPRFDIAPGSSVQIVVSSDRFVSKEVPGPFFDMTVIYGLVIGLTLQFDAMSPAAYSNIQIGYLRTFWETIDSTKSYITPEHPVWQYSWLGAPLHQHPAFLPKFNSFFGRIK